MDNYFFMGLSISGLAVSILLTLINYPDRVYSGKKETLEKAILLKTGIAHESLSTTFQNLYEEIKNNAKANKGYFKTIMESYEDDFANFNKEWKQWVDLKKIKEKIYKWKGWTVYAQIPIIFLLLVFVVVVISPIIIVEYFVYLGLFVGLGSIISINFCFHQWLLTKEKWVELFK